MAHCCVLVGNLAAAAKSLLGRVQLRPLCAGTQRQQLMCPPLLGASSATTFSFCFRGPSLCLWNGAQSQHKERGVCCVCGMMAGLV